MQRLISICLLLLIIAIALYSGFILGKTYTEPQVITEYITEPLEISIDLDYALGLSHYGLRAHKYYVRNPGQCNDYSGNVSFNQEWFEYYEEIIVLLEYLIMEKKD